MDMITVSLTPALRKFVTAQCLKIVEPEILDPSLAAGLPKGGLDVLDALALVGKNIRASKGPGYPFEEVYQQASFNGTSRFSWVLVSAASRVMTLFWRSTWSHRKPKISPRLMPVQ